MTRPFCFVVLFPRLIQAQVQLVCCLKGLLCLAMLDYCTTDPCSAFGSTEHCFPLLQHDTRAHQGPIGGQNKQISAGELAAACSELGPASLKDNLSTRWRLSRRFFERSRRDASENRSGSATARYGSFFLRGSSWKEANAESPVKLSVASCHICRVGGACFFSAQNAVATMDKKKKSDIHHE